MSQLKMMIFSFEKILICHKPSHQPSSSIQTLKSFDVIFLLRKRAAESNHAFTPDRHKFVRPSAASSARQSSQQRDDRSHEPELRSASEGMAGVEKAAAHARRARARKVRMLIVCVACMLPQINVGLVSGPQKICDLGMDVT